MGWAARVNDTAQQARCGRLAPKPRAERIKSERERLFENRWFDMMDRVFGLLWTPATGVLRSRRDAT